MSQVESFLTKVKSDAGLQAQISGLAASSKGELVAGVKKIASGAGFSLSDAEISSAIEAQTAAGKKGQLSDADLEKVAGGGCSDLTCWVSHYTKSKCEGLTSW